MIKTIIFDFGDVFINLDKPAIIRELKKLGVPFINSEMYIFPQITVVFINSEMYIFPQS